MATRTDEPIPPALTPTFWAVLCIFGGLWGIIVISIVTNSSGEVHLGHAAILGFVFGFAPAIVLALDMPMILARRRATPAQAARYFFGVASKLRPQVSAEGSPGLSLDPTALLFGLLVWLVSLGGAAGANEWIERRNRKLWPRLSGALARHPPGQERSLGLLEFWATQLALYPHVGVSILGSETLSEGFALVDVRFRMQREAFQADTSTARKLVVCRGGRWYVVNGKPSDGLDLNLAKLITGTDPGSNP